MVKRVYFIKIFGGVELSDAELIANFGGVEFVTGNFFLLYWIVFYKICFLDVHVRGSEVWIQLNSLDRILELESFGFKTIINGHCYGMYRVYIFMDYIFFVGNLRCV